MLKAIIAGSYDPLTFGHIDIIRRSLAFCDQLVIAIGINLQKKTMFSVEERLDMLSVSIYDSTERITTSSYQGLLVDYAKSIGAKYLIRGVRNAVDFEYESQLAQINKKIAPEIETVFLLTSPELSVVSSSAVKEIAHYGGDITGFVNPYVAKKINEKLAFIKAGDPENK